MKPTTLLSSVPETFPLAGLRADHHQAEEWSSDFETRMEQSKRAAEWSPGLIETLQKAILRKQSQSRFGPRTGQVRRHPGRYDRLLDSRRVIRERLGLPPLPDERLAIRALDAKQLEDWKVHVSNEHYPARRDCAQCLKNMGRDRPHTRTKVPSAFCLNLDVAGPFRQGHDQCPGTGPRYFMVGVYTVPLHQGGPLVERLQQLGALKEKEVWKTKSENGGAQVQDSRREYGGAAGTSAADEVYLGSDAEIRAVRVAGQELYPDQEEGAAVQCDDHAGGQRGDDGHGGAEAQARPAPEGQQHDLWEELAQGGVPPDEDISETVIKELDLENQRWLEEISGLQDVRVCNLTLALPLKSRHANDIIEVTSLMYGRLRSLGLPLHRVHTDRAREFTSRQFSSWLRQRDVVHTTTGGDEHQGCARAEGEINVLKGRTRLLMDTAKADLHLWPLALRHAAEHRFREQLASLGVRLPKLIPFGSQGMARFKRWHHVKDKDVWQHPMQKVTIYGPAYDMSPTSNGYYVECDGRWMRSTVVVQPRSPEPGQGQTLVPVPAEVAEEDISAFLAHPEAPSPGDELFAVVETDNGKFIEEDIEIDPQDELPRLTHRLHGKQTWPPVLRAVRTGGEWPSDEKTDEDYIEECKAQWKDISEVYNAMAMELLQLEELRKVEREEKATMLSSEDAKLVLRIGKECDKLEHRLKALNVVEENYNQVPKECQETLVTRSVTLEEVRGDLEQWKGALQAEYQSLIDHGAIRPLSDEEFKKVKETNEEVTTIPGMLVATVKPPCRKKARVVACGNYIQEAHDKQEVSAGGLDAIVTRSLVALASRKQWTISTADVKTAFLQAPRRATPGRATCISPPSVLRDAGVLQKGPGERWLVTGALYGLVESPRDWATFRDSQLKKMSWVNNNGHEVRIFPTAEPHLWEVRETKSKKVRAYLGIYVDDIMVIGEKEVMEQVMQDLQRVFYMSPYTRRSRKSMQ